MGRGRPPKVANTKAATPPAAVKTPREKVVKKSYAEDSGSDVDMATPLAAVKTPREKVVKKSYAEDSGSEGSDVDMKKKVAEESPSPAAVEQREKEEVSSEDEVLATTKAKSAAPAKRGAPAASGSKNNAARTSRDRASIKQSYKEDDDSEEERYSDEKPSSPEVNFSDVDDDDDDDDFAAESSGSEYGKKKRKSAPKKVSPAKGRGRGRKKAGSASPKKRGRKPAASGSVKSKNGRAAKKRPADSDEEEEMSNASDSDEEYVAKASSSRGTKRAAVASPRGGRGRKPTPKKPNLDLSDEELDEKSDKGGDSEDEEVAKPAPSAKSAKRAPAPKKSKKEATPRAPPSRASARKPPADKRISYAEMDNEDDDFEEAVVKKPTSKRGAPARKSSLDKKPAVAAPMEVDEEEEADAKEEAKPSKQPTADSSSEADGDEAADTKEPEPKPKKEKPVEAKPAVDTHANGNGTKSKAIDDDEDEKDQEQESDEANGDETEAKVASNGTGLKNRTDTDWESLDFSCDKKTDKGEPWNLKLASWNVGGAKSWVSKNGLKYLEKESPDVLCLQEIRCSEKTRPENLKTAPGYPYCYWLHSEGSGGHGGVATFCKTEPLSVVNGLPIGEDDNEKDKKLKEMFNGEGRLVATEFEKFYLLNTYIPNSGSGVTDEEHKTPYPKRICNGERPAWDRFFLKYVQDLQTKKPVIVTGDLNVAHESIDLANPGTNKRTAGYTVEERDAFNELLEETGLCDSFRYMNPSKEGAYTFWSYRFNAREKNVGWRLDYFLVSPKIREGLCEATIRPDVYGSDHCPIVVWARV